MKSAPFILMAAALVACGNAKPAATAETAPPPKPVAVDTTPKAVSTNVGLGGDIIAACNIQFSQTTDAPKFDTDSTGLSPEDTKVLDQVATCLTTGPLKGRSLQLVGRADSRGTESYNMALGANRAHQVMTYLQQKGVTAKMNETSRGALDATGHDDASYRNDRRVDLVLGS